MLVTLLTGTQRARFAAIFGLHRICVRTAGVTSSV
jgi:ribosomal protein S14